MTAEIGMNLANVTYYNVQYPFIDRMKTASEWIVQGGPANLTEADLNLDANGYLRELPAGAGNAYLMVGLDPAPLAMPDRYVLTWEGNASFFINSARIVSQSEGRIVFEYAGEGNHTAINIGGLTASNPLHNMHLVREDQVGLFAQGKTFNPAFLESIDDWSVLRFMDWGNTNGNTLTSWSQRTTPDSLSWAANRTHSSVPVEVMVKLANEAGTDMWLNIPAMADDDYVRRTLAYVRDNLADGLKVKVEYSNEVWNGQFTQTHYAQQQGSLLWGRDANGDGRINPDDGAEKDGQGNLHYYGYRSAQVAAIGNEVFGAAADARLVNVLATQTAWKGLEDPIFWGVDKAGKGGVGTLFDEYAVTTYFGPQADVNQMLAWSRAGEAGMAAAFRSMRQMLDENKSLYDYQQWVANRYGLDMVAYEGGTHMTAFQAPQVDQATLVEFIKKLDADPRMGEMYAKMAADFSAAGGTSLTAFSDVGGTTIWGDWGVKFSTYDAESVKYNALVAVQQQATRTAPSKTEAALNLPDATSATVGKVSTSSPGNLIRGGDSGGGLWGTAGADTLIGGSGSDKLDGGSGTDLMIGGRGDDSYGVDSAADMIIEFSGGSSENVYASVSYVLPAEIECLHLSGTGSLSGTGNAIANWIFGNDSGNRIFGRGGDDELYGRGGDDTISGDEGADRLMGENGDDILLGGAGDDVLMGGVGNDILIGGAGRDMLWGDGGADRFVFLPGELATTPEAADVVIGFSAAEGDRVDLSLVDANVRLAGDQAFRFIGSKAFSGSAGELRLEAGPGYVLASGDVDGNGTADVYLYVSSWTAPAGASDFIF